MMRIIFVLFFCFFSLFSQASVIVYGTRVVYNSNDKSINVELQNEGIKPSLVQVWIEDEKKNTKVPFIISPPVSRIEPNNRQTLRISYTGESLPKDRETLFYFNMFDVPPKPSENELTSPSYLQFAVNSKLKLFFRPNNLSMTVSEAREKVEWDLDGKYIVANNVTPYYITYSSILVKQGNRTYKAKNADMIPPFSKMRFQMDTTVKGSAQVEWNIIDDFGAHREGVSSIN
ncbi:molecular chaperone [Otariodibacter oris]|uniref:Chaperone protein HifB n=1 Tax=Otariodibacter oris TaxID=1032623 RepID=A0A420XFZ6_9PAST|nr:fimbria/pilus periplasmic chaperone [Otariodibacter oris]QGM79936.1 molecular chaperone [Otariodibacter oris]RKR71757.1 chaperone protein EcpD [Otariodibacter oris]